MILNENSTAIIISHLPELQRELSHFQKNSCPADIYQHDFAEIFQLAADIDLRSLVQCIFSISRPSTNLGYPRHRITFEGSQSNLFDAYAELSTDDNRVNINISRGVFISLRDLFFRMASCNDFFSLDFGDGKRRLWPGCTCSWLHSSALILPKKRYINYSPIPNWEYLATAETEPNPSSNQRILHSSTLSQFMTSFPLDPDRFKLAQLMANIAIAFVFFHEEAHYMEGHLLFINSLGIDDSRCRISEVDDSSNLPWDAQNNRVIEWQADRTAIRAVVDVFFNNRTLALLPKYCKADPIWLLRAIVVAIGGAMMVLHKGRYVNSGANQSNIDSGYPTPLARIGNSIFVSFYQLFQNLQNETAALVPEFRMLPYSIFGILDDLNTVAHLIGREIPHHTWEPADFNEMTQPENLHLLDNEKEVTVFAHMFISELFGDVMIGMEKLFKSNENTRRLYQETCFDKLANIIALHDEKLFSFFQKFRRAVGNDM